AARQIDLTTAGVAPVKLKVLRQGEVVSSGFAIQVGAFENRTAAEDLKKSLQKKYPTTTIQAFSAEKTIYRVRIGEPDIETANKIVAELRKRDLMPFVVRVNGED